MLYEIAPNVSSKNREIGGLRAADIATNVAKDTPPSSRSRLPECRPSTAAFAAGHRPSDRPPSGRFAITKGPMAVARPVHGRWCQRNSDLRARARRVVRARIRPADPSDAADAAPESWRPARVAPSGAGRDGAIRDSTTRLKARSMPGWPYTSYDDTSGTHNSGTILGLLTSRYHAGSCRDQKWASR